MTGSQEAPVCCGNGDLVTWWWAGSQHGGVEEGVRVHWVSKDVIIVITY